MKGSKIFILLCFSLSCISCSKIDISDSEFDPEKVNVTEIRSSPYYRKFEIFPEQGFEILEITSGDESIWFPQPDETCRMITLIKRKLSPVILILDVSGSGYFYFKEIKEWNRVDFYKYSRLFDQINTDHGSYTLDLEKPYQSPLVNVERYTKDDYSVVDFYCRLKYYIGDVKYKDDFLFDPNKVDSDKNWSEDQPDQNDNNKYIISFVKLSHNESSTFIEIKVESNIEQKTFYFCKGKHGWISIPESEYTEGITNSNEPTDTSQEPDLNPQHSRDKSPSDSSTSDDQNVPNKDTGTDSNPKSDEFQEDGEETQGDKPTKPNSVKPELTHQELPHLKGDLKDSEEDDLINSLESGLKDPGIRQRLIKRGKELGEIPLKVIKRVTGSFVLNGKSAPFLAVIITILIIF